jgi:hypothetical protein
MFMDVLAIACTLIDIRETTYHLPNRIRKLSPHNHLKKTQDITADCRQPENADNSEIERQRKHLLPSLKGSHLSIDSCMFSFRLYENDR